MRWDNPRVGEVYKDEGDDFFTADINIGDHYGKVQCYGKTESEARNMAEAIVAFMKGTE